MQTHPVPQVRARVADVRDTLSRGLSALGASASGAPAWALPNLDELSQLALPLLTSPLVGSGAAYSCARQLALCLPGALGCHAGDVASALRVTRLTEQVRRLDWTSWSGSTNVACRLQCLDFFLPRSSACVLANTGWLEASPQL